MTSVYVRSREKIVWRLYLVIPLLTFLSWFVSVQWVGPGDELPHTVANDVGVITLGLLAGGFVFALFSGPAAMAWARSGHSGIYLGFGVGSALLSTAVSWVLNDLGRIDCGNECSGVMPTGVVNTVELAVQSIFWLAAALLIYRWMRLHDRRVTLSPSTPGLEPPPPARADG